MRAIPTKQPTNDSAQQKKKGNSVRSSRSISPLSTGMPLLQPRCACGGGCPRCKEDLGIQTKLKIGNPNDQYEQEANRVAKEVINKKNPEQMEVEPVQHLHPNKKHTGKKVNLSLKPSSSKQTPNLTGQNLTVKLANHQSLGMPLAVDTREFFESRFGRSFSDVHVHTDTSAGEIAQSLNARAFTYGQHIYFAPGAYQPQSRTGQQLIAHELTHTLQQRKFSAQDVTHSRTQETSISASQSSSVLSHQAPVETQCAMTADIARSVDEWLVSSVNPRAMSYTELLSEIDELNDWLSRQIESSEDTARIEDAITMLRREAARREKQTQQRKRKRRSARTSRRATTQLSQLSTDLRKPRILEERTSVQYQDSQEMRAEFDLIMEWLARGDLSSADREILQAERENLRPLLQESRAEAITKRRTERLRLALTSNEKDQAATLEQFARTIEGIFPDLNNPQISYLLHQNEQIAISTSQAEKLRNDLLKQLQKAHQRIQQKVDGAWTRYQAMVKINEDTFLIDDIAAWLGDVEDPFLELVVRRSRALAKLDILKTYLKAKQLVNAVNVLPDIERNSQVIDALADAFVNGHIEGAETAISGLEFTRDASFVIAGSIATIIAAPFVAGAVGAGGAGLTGVSAGVATTLGTGTLVGTGTAVVRGTSAAAGHAVVGSSGEEISEAFISESVRGFREGFTTGAAGGAARVLGPAFGVGANVSGQVARRVAAEAIVDGTSAMLETLLNGGSIEEAVTVGLRSAALSVPGALVGSAGSRLTRELGGPLTAGATAYTGAIAAGASPEEAMRSAGLAVTSNLVMSRATHGSEADAALEARGQEFGKHIRQTVQNSATTLENRTRSVVAAITIGTADPVPAFRIGAGGTTVDVGELTSRHESRVRTLEQSVDQDVNPDSVWESLRQELELTPHQSPSQATVGQRIEAAVSDAQAAGWIDQQGNPIPGSGVDVATQPHGRAPDVRRALGITGAEAQSAHIGATSLLRRLNGYSRRLANTVLLNRATHRAFDQHWLRWVANERRAIRASGSTDFTAPLSDVLNAQRRAIRQIPGLSPGQLSTMESMLEAEILRLVADLPEGLATRVPLPAVLGS